MLFNKSCIIIIVILKCSISKEECQNNLKLFESFTSRVGIVKSYPRIPIMDRWHMAIGLARSLIHDNVVNHAEGPSHQFKHSLPVLPGCLTVGVP